MPVYTRLRSIGDVTKQSLTDAIEENVIAFFDWGVMNAGGFVTVPVTNPGTNDPYQDELLHPVVREGVADRTIWEAPHGNWVYATGLEVDVPPAIASGVFVSGTFYPTATTTGQYAHTLNFAEGRVTFAQPLPATAVVQAEYSYRWVNWYDQDTPWFRDVVFDPLLVPDQPQGSGFTQLLSDYRVRLPAVIVEPVMTRRQRGVMLGSAAQWVEQDILFHIIAARADERNSIMDLISLEENRSFYLFDVNARRVANDFDQDANGSPITGAKMYPDLVAPPPSGYRWKQARFSNMQGQDVSLRLPLYRGIVRATVEVDYVSM